MNEKGFAVTGLLYIILILFVSMYASMLAMYTTRRNMLEEIKQDIAGDAIKGSGTGPSYITPTLGNVGDYVDYVPDNATWNLAIDSVSEVTGTAQGTFDIYDKKLGKAVTGLNKTDSITCYTSSYVNKYNGFRIMDVDKDGVMTLIHAGTPECYYHNQDSEKSVSTLNTESTKDNVGLSKAWTKYGNTNLALSVRYMNMDDMKKVTGKADPYNDCQGSMCDDISLVNTGSYYYLANMSSKNSNNLYYWVPDKNFLSDFAGGIAGVRPVIKLKPNVKLGTGSGTATSPRQLVLA